MASFVKTKKINRRERGERRGRNLKLKSQRSVRGLKVAFGPRYQEQKCDFPVQEDLSGSVAPKPTPKS